MASLTRTRQPQQVAANPYWLARGLSHLATGDLLYDAAIGKSGTVFLGGGATKDRRITSAGVGSVHINNARIDSTGARLTSDFTALFVGDLTADTTPKFAFDVYLPTTEFIVLGANFDDQRNAASGRLSLTILEFTTVNRSHAYVAGAIDGTLSAYLIRKRGSVVSMWKNGQQLSVTSSGGFPSFPVTSAADPFEVGAYCGGSTGVGTLVMTATLKAALTDAECGSLATLKGCWQLFSDLPERRRASVGGPAFNPAWARQRAQFIGMGVR